MFDSHVKQQDNLKAWQTDQTNSVQDPQPMSHLYISRLKTH